ncbi:MAG: hypothetical protein JWR18_767 [Segetibacter sp.]|nr:hypothetical protein [Segetibacter sp.]
MNHKHTNRLVNETSPYLLQHAHNPVDWFSWGDEALEKAKREDKPILVSIGYAACHWCHVMERESFENEETAQLMNEHFVNIKIDREERPDIDHIYMDAVQTMTGSGGWPLNVFLTPDGRPFYGGTYFPPVRAYNRSSWPEVLTAISHTYKEKKDEIEDQAEKLTEHLRNANAFGAGNSSASNMSDLLTQTTLNEIASNLLKSADKTWGGFGKAPKFPQTFSIKYLLRHYHFTNDEAALQHALLSIDKMIYGGIYDQLGGGFARYSTDDQWLAPHFEKMLYDNAMIIEILAEAFQITNNPVYSETIRHTIDFVRREMMSDEGGFYSALDADSEGIEGKFYTWSKKEIESVLEEDARIFCAFYNVTESGNWEHTNILHVTRPLQDFAAENGLNEEEFSGALKKQRQQLMAERSKRIRPQLDDKILLGWNALMNIACSRAYAATGEMSYKEMAIRNAAFLETSFHNIQSDDWSHTYKNGLAKYPAFLDDYAYLISAYIHLQEITGNADYLLKAKSITGLVIDKFSEEKTGFFFFTSKDQKDVIIRKKEVYDAATPSGNSVMAANLHYLGIVFNKPEWIEQSVSLVGKLANTITRYPTSFGNWACQVQQIVNGVPEIAVTGKNALELLPELLKEYIPVRILQTSNRALESFPLLAGKDVSGTALIYVCKAYSCQKPVRNVGEIKSLLK